MSALDARSRLSSLVEEVVVPLVEADGGTVEILEIGDALVRLRLGGACAGCPGRMHTQAHVIEPLVKTKVGVGVEVHVE